MEKVEIEILENCNLIPPYFTNEKWVPHLNFSEEIRSKMDIPKKIIIHDVTLRDGEQTAGIVFTEDEKVFIAQELDRIGIPLIEVGTPAVSDDDKRVFRRLSEMNLRAKTLALSRVIEKDVELAIENKADGIFLETSINPYFLKHVVGWDVNELIKRAIRCTKLAKKAGLFVEFCGWETFRVSNLDVIKRVFSEIVDKVEVDQIGISDTFGQAHPLVVQFLVKKMKEWVPDVPLSFHIHNDFGLATGSVMMAVVSGVDAVECAFNGLGERAGNVATEEVIASLELLMNIDTGINLKEIYRVSKLVEEISKLKVARTKSIIGDGIFDCESGIVVDANIKLEKKLGLKDSFFPYSPSVFGRKSKYVGGKKSGKAFVKNILIEKGLSATDEQITKILEKVKSRGIILKNILSDQELDMIVEEEISS
ncbi:MAG TPA: homocitrate synthase [Candidatus Atribacteria bacterium]|nr:homocitrate synthase [Candidatus Atribacteria bacterium]